jgi:hypothetical protein
LPEIARTPDQETHTPPIVTNKKHNTTSTLVNVKVFDDTRDADLTLFNATLDSVDAWIVSNTVLLISRPQSKVENTYKSRLWLSLSSNSHVDVDPHTTDALWLRQFAQKRTTLDHINPPAPDDGGNCVQRHVSCAPAQLIS